MAKGNLFLGTAAKSVGDVVMYRRDGSQVSRVRVRKIANPKTDAQCKQRAIMAPIPKFYSPLAIVLERSFEGLSKSKSYSKFLKVNADKARANDWLLPKGTGFFPLPYELSAGSLPTLGYSLGEGTYNLDLNISAASYQEGTIGEISTDLVNAGFKNGDVVTIIGVRAAEDNGPFAPLSVQFIIDTESTASLSTLRNSGLNIICSENKWHVNTVTDFLYAGAIIISRWENDKWRRSTQVLEVDSAVISAITTTSAKDAAIASYRGTVDGGNPLVYLDGDELQ